jgi:hypothetical protein
MNFISDLVAKLGIYTNWRYVLDASVNDSILKTILKVIFSALL